jgi:hypothetical protein
VTTKLESRGAVLFEITHRSCHCPPIGHAPTSQPRSRLATTGRDLALEPSVGALPPQPWPSARHCRQDRPRGHASRPARRGPVGSCHDTDEERECFYTIKAILHPVIDSKRLALRDVQTYCGVLLDDNNRKPICRLYLNGPRKAIGLFDSDDRKEARVSINGSEDLHEFTDRLRATRKSVLQTCIGARAARCWSASDRSVTTADGPERGSTPRPRSGSPGTSSPRRPG